MEKPSTRLLLGINRSGGNGRRGIFFVPSRYERRQSTIEIDRSVWSTALAAVVFTSCAKRRPY